MGAARADACFALTVDKNGFQQQLKLKHTPGKHQKARPPGNEERPTSNLSRHLGPQVLTASLVSILLPAPRPGVLVVKGRLGSRWRGGAGATGGQEDPGDVCAAANPSCH